MERRKLFTRMRRPEDAGSFAGEEPERGPQSPGDEPAEEIEPSPEFPPAEVDAEELPAQVAESEKPQGRKNRGASARAMRPPAANLSLVRRERRALVRERERRIRDLGGLLLEMYRRDQFREDLIVEHCAQTMGVENRIHELEAILTRRNSRRSSSGPHCACGAPLFFGARFCASCGRPTDLASTGELCANCLQPLDPGASFCAGCGAALSGTASPEKPGEQTISHSIPAAEEAEEEPAEHEDSDR
ncbi:MAG: zinc ribbon domain-containing protein [Gaiellaceae bacterium]